MNEEIVKAMLYRLDKIEEQAKSLISENERLQKRVNELEDRLEKLSGIQTHDGI